MNHWQYVEEQFNRLAMLDAQEQLLGIERLKVPEDLDAIQVAKDLQSLLMSHSLSEEENFLTARQTIRTMVGEFKNHTKKRSTVFSSFQQLGQYTLLEKLGNGSFGQVFLAHDRQLERKVAIKITPDLGGEAQTMALLDHPHIVKVHAEHVLQEEGIRLVSMQYISGPTLEMIFRAIENKQYQSVQESIEALSRRLVPMNAKEHRNWEHSKKKDSKLFFLEIIADLAEALEYAHECNILHLDVKPANILLSPAGSVYLADFNISTNSQKVEVLGGSRDFMSPEQEAIITKSGFVKVDARSDIYSLAAVLKYGLNLISLEQDTCDLLEDDLSAILNKAMQAEPAQRFSSMKQFHQALRHHLALRLSVLGQEANSSLCALARKYPLPCIMAAGAFPHLLGSAISIAYNFLRIISDLSVTQKIIFERTVLIYNILAIGCASIYILWRMYPAIKQLQLTKNSSNEFSRNILDSASRRMLETIPKDLFLVATLGWLPGMLIFPLIIDKFSSGLSLDSYIHFAISFSLSWAISVTYSVTFFTFACLFIVEPHYLGGRFFRSRISVSLVEQIKRSLSFYHQIAAILPMLMALLILTIDPVSGHDDRYLLFRGLSVALLILGMSAYLFLNMLKYRAFTWMESLSKPADNAV